MARSRLYRLAVGHQQFNEKPSPISLLGNCVVRKESPQLSSINTIHVKQQNKVGFFIFKFTLKCMLGNVYINKIYAMQCLYIIRLYFREGLSHPSTITLLYPKESFTSNSKTARKKRFFNGTTSN